MPLQISVIGGNEPTESQRSSAYEVGEQLASRDVTVVCGGGTGVMEETARGVQSVKTGRVIGIRPDDDRTTANDYLDDVILTGVGYARNLAVVLSGQAIIAIGGRFGTLSEIAFSKKYERPIFGIETWQHDRLDFEADLDPATAVSKALEAAG